MIIVILLHAPAGSTMSSKATNTFESACHQVGLSEMVFHPSNNNCCINSIFIWKNNIYFFL